jgi:hypothetical protein
MRCPKAPHNDLQSPQVIQRSIVSKLIEALADPP